MGGNEIFVGRQRELERLQEGLADPTGYAGVGGGPAGRGGDVERRVKPAGDPRRVKLRHGG